MIWTVSKDIVMLSRSKMLERYVKERVDPIGPFSFIRLSRENLLTLIHPFKHKLWLIKLAFKIIKNSYLDEEDFLYQIAYSYLSNILIDYEGEVEEDIEDLIEFIELKDLHWSELIMNFDFEEDVKVDENFMSAEEYEEAIKDMDHYYAQKERALDTLIKISDFIEDKEDPISLAIKKIMEGEEYDF